MWDMWETCADHDHDGYTGIIFMLELWKTKLQQLYIVPSYLLETVIDKMRNNFCSNLNAFNIYDVNCLEKYFW